MPRRARSVLVLGLGNPGEEYAGTRHNVGFEVVERVAARLGRPWLLRGRSLVARWEHDERPVMLAKPQTYMNRSGRAAADLLADLPAPAGLLVVCDDFNLPLARLRCRLKGSAGGQKGLASILEAVGEREVPRLRIGIGEPGRAPPEEYVLRPFKRGERPAIDEAIQRATDLVLAWIEHGDDKKLVADCNAPL